MDNPNITRLAEKMKQLPDDKLFEIVQNIEKLSLELIIEFKNEIKKSTSLNIISNGY